MSTIFEGEVITLTVMCNLNTELEKVSNNLFSIKNKCIIVNLTYIKLCKYIPHNFISCINYVNAYHIY